MKKIEIPGTDCSIFNSISSATMDKLNKIRELKKYNKGDLIFYEGKKVSGLYCLNQGHVKIYKNSKDGDHRIIYLSLPGDLVGWEPLTEEVYSNNAEALDEVTVSCFPIPAFLAMMKEDNLLLLELVKYLCKGKQMLESKIIQLFNYPLKQRLAINLLLLIEKFGTQYNQNILLRVPLSRMDMANLIGTNPETVFKLLSQFKKEGIIDFVDKRLLILNPSKLKSLSDF